MTEVKLSNAAGLSMPKSYRFAFVSAVVVLLQLTSGTANGGQPSPVVERRQQAMKDMARATKTIAAMFSGDQSYDKTKFQEAASVFVTHGGAGLSALFAGSADAKSEADDQKIAAEREAFDKIAARLEELAAAFHQKASRAGNAISADMRMGSGVSGGSLLGARPLRSESDLSAIPAEHLFHMMLGTCTACHSRYRLEK